jgi:tetratricopeptide (TPR) repeat protein
LPKTPETKNCYADLETAIKKASGVIEHHAIVKKGSNPPQEIPEAGKWIDDSYLVIGQAHYYKGEYLAALEVFDYVIQKYAKFPSRYEALLWKAKVQIELGDYTDAESLLDMIANDKACPEKLTAEIKATYAHLYMTTGNYNSAIKNLEEAVELTKRPKKTRARYLYVLGQLYEKTGKKTKAYDVYGQVADLHPDYSMYFNAKLSRARLSASSKENREASKRELQKMLQDGKNTEFQDQIYYTLAELEKGSGNETEAMRYYRLSISTSVENNKQKALSYLALGDIYFSKPEYKNAQAYYDSTMMFLPKDYPDYKNIDEKQKSLTNLVKYINTVSSEDSLQKIVQTYGSDTTKLYPYIDKLIAQEKLEEKRRKELLEQKLSQGTNPVAQSGGLQQGGAGAWYFYNPSTVSYGVNEFNRKWGNRKLEDNWRRNNKESLIPIDNGDPQDTAKAVASGKNDKNDKYSREYYTKNLPFTKEAQAASDEKIADAYYNLGTIYKEQMKDREKSVEAFEALCKRFPKHKYAMPAHYQLYKLYGEMNNTAKATEHKDYICNNFPDGEYCQLILHPESIVEGQNAKKAASTYYDSTYTLYLRKDFAQVVARCNYADTSFGTKVDKNPHAAKFAYLRAVSLGQTQGTPAMESALIRLIAKYPTDPIKPQAESLLDAIRKQRGETTSTVSTPKDSLAPPAYIANAKTEFQFMIVFENGKGDVNKFRNELSNFNTSSFASSNLSISTIALDNKRTCIMVKKFVDQARAVDYYNTLKTHPEIFANLQAGSYQVFAISTENFALFFKDKRTEMYKTFFENNVLEKK